MGCKSRYSLCYTYLQRSISFSEKGIKREKMVTVLQVFVAVVVVVCYAQCAQGVSELQIETIKNGDCSRTAKDGDQLMMHYEGTLMDGKEFDSSYKRGDPFRFTLGAGMVIQGWEKGLDGMCKGEIRNLIIPYSMAYGEAGHPPVIPEKADLKFKVELLDFEEDEEQEDL